MVRHILKSLLPCNIIILECQHSSSFIYIVNLGVGSNYYHPVTCATITALVNSNLRYNYVCHKHLNGWDVGRQNDQFCGSANQKTLQWHFYARFQCLRRLLVYNVGMQVGRQVRKVYIEIVLRGFHCDEKESALTIRPSSFEQFSQALCPLKLEPRVVYY